MNLLDTLVDDILSRNEDLLTLRPVVEKEVFHQEILREMAEYWTVLTDTLKESFKRMSTDTVS